jgi:hypothetical protein
MSVTFKCNRTGNTVSFTAEHDIKTMREHPEYTEVIETLKPVEVFSNKEQSFSEAEQPKRGRPKKTVEDTDTDSI